MSKTVNPKKGLALRCYFSPASGTCGNISGTAKHVHCNPAALTRWVHGPEAQQIKAEIQSEVQQASIISVRQLQERLLRIADEAESKHQYHAAISALATLLKTVGGFMADRLPAENLAGKILDAQRAEDLRAIADRYYAEQYLAQPKAIEDFQGTIPVSPHAPPA
jgi:hypothetical protein